MQVTTLYHYPVKSLGGHSVPCLQPEIRGFKDDRRWMFVEPDGTFITCRAVPSLLRRYSKV
ncbi:MAG: MOSC N-terminal beta barrel domain-containing protein, partial [Bacteroidota bacterium]